MTVGWQINKDPKLGPSSSNHANFVLKIVPMTTSVGW